jgi:MoaA/NifB/PqqE/SkfB family radical SAM enzyme
VKQFEIQLGHLCNNRCVFCVSGALTHTGEAPFLDESELLARLRRARAEGHTRVTLLGGEPTIQPYFMDVVREAVALRFDEIVIFSNGSKPGRTDLIDEVIATGGRFEWRFSFQGATREAHERTTRRKGSFEQLVRSLGRVRARGQRATVNMCIVRQNFESLPAFPSLLMPHGVSQLHVDMLNPYDTGTLPEPEVRALQPRYSELAAPLTGMVAGFPDGFDVNVGNLPYCVAPHLAPWIHHGGQPTWTVTADDLGGRSLQREKQKYLLKADRRVKPEGCGRCVYDDRCAGAFDLYLRWYGDGELVPVTQERLREIDPTREQLALHLRPFLRSALEPASLPAPFTRASVGEHDLRSVTIALATADPAGPALSLRLRRGGGGVARMEEFAVDVVEARGDGAMLAAALRALWAALLAAGCRSISPPGDDAFVRPRPAVAAAAARLRSAVPHGALALRDVRLVDGGDRAEFDFESPSGERAVVWFAEQAGRCHAGYRVDHRADPARAASPSLVAGLRAALGSLGAMPARSEPARQAP